MIDYPKGSIAYEFGRIDSKRLWIRSTGFDPYISRYRISLGKCVVALNVQEAVEKIAVNKDDVVCIAHYQLGNIILDPEQTICYRCKFINCRCEIWESYLVGTQTTEHSKNQ